MIEIAALVLELDGLAIAKNGGVFCCGQHVGDDVADAVHNIELIVEPCRAQWDAASVFGDAHAHDILPCRIRGAQKGSIARIYGDG